jgi:hypothetical protein
MAKIYFCGSIRGGRQLAATYGTIIRMLRFYGEVLTEHVGDPDEISGIDQNRTDQFIHDRDMQWIRESDMIVAEVTQPSLGVGYEIGRAVDMKKPILCLFDPSTGNRLSAMIAGSEGVNIYEYSNLDDLGEALKEFISEHAPRRTS